MNSLPEAPRDISGIRSQARRAGAWYVLMLLTAPLGLLVVPERIIVSGDATATAENLRRAEWLVRAGIASELVHQVVFIFLVLALYRLFRPVDKTQARLVVILGAFMSVPIVFLNVLNEVAALTLAQGAPYLAAFDEAQRDALAYLFLRLHGTGIQVAGVFWGLWLFPFGWLVIRCGFIPRVLGWLLIAAGSGYVIGSTTALVLPQYRAATSGLVGVLEFGELPIILWLATWGARGQR